MIEAMAGTYINMQNWRDAEALFYSKSALSETGSVVQDSFVRAYMRTLGTITSASEMSKMSGHGAMSRNIWQSTEGPWIMGWAGYELGDFYMKAVSSMGVGLNYKLTEYGIFSERQYAELYAVRNAGSTTEFKHMNKLYKVVDGKFTRDGVEYSEAYWKKSLNAYLEKQARKEHRALDGSFLDMLDVKDGEIVLKDEWKDKVSEVQFEEAMNKVRKTSRHLASQIDGNISETDRGHISTTVWGGFLTQHRNPLINIVESQFVKPLGVNWETGQREEAVWRTLFYRGKDNPDKSFISQWAQEMWANKLNFIKSSREVWSRLDSLERMNVRRAISQLFVIGMLIMAGIVFGALWPPEDDMPSKNSWAENFAEYAFLIRPLFEQAATWNMFEWENMLSNPLVASSMFHRMAMFWNAANFFGDPVATGPYKGWSKGARWWIRQTPMKQFVEVQHPETKMSFIVNNMLK
jgi:hypothetical protein